MKNHNKTLLKVLNKDLSSPFQKMTYKIGKKYHCNDFDENKNNTCSNGFYATDIDGLLYSYNINRKIYEVKIWGKEVEIDSFKRRYENIEIMRQIPISEIIKRIKKENWNKKMNYKLSEVLKPINPLQRRFKKDILKKDIELLKKWASVKNSVKDLVWNSVRNSVRDSVKDSVGGSVRDLVWDSVWNSIGDLVGGSVRDSVKDSVGGSVRNSVKDSVGGSVRNSVRDSVGGSVRNLVWGSVRDSVWDSVRDSIEAYISSLFPKIKKWKYFEHNKNENPFQSGINLWKSGIVPSFNNEIWRLHGINGKILFEISKEKLNKILI